MKPWKIIASALVLGTLSSAAVPPAVAAPLMTVGGSERLAASGQPVTEVQYRRGFRGPHHHHHHRHGYGHRRGVGAGAVIGGLAAGAIIGGAIASSQAQAQANQAASYCAQRYRSYDPASGTYLATDGYRRPCP